MLSKQQKNGFYLIWIYWLKKHMKHSSIHNSKQSQSLLQKYQKIYSIEIVEGTKISLIRQHYKNKKWPIFIIDPQKQIKQMQQLLKDEDDEYKNQLFSYYLNIRNVYVIYSSQLEQTQKSIKKVVNEHQLDNVSQGNHYKSLLIHDDRTQGNKSRPEYNNSSSLMDKIFHSLEDQTSSYRDISQYQSAHLKIQELQMLDRMAEIDGLQVWNCKYKKIPHSFLKIKNQAWKNCLNLNIVHPCQPKLLNSFPIMPRIHELKPNMNKLMSFVSYIKLLDKHLPRFSPVLGSIFQINGLPIVFSKQQTGWNNQTNIGVLCYYVAKGDENILNASSVEKWAQLNSQTLLGGIIQQMKRRFKQKYRQKRDTQSKGLALYDSSDYEGQNIW